MVGGREGARRVRVSYQWLCEYVDVRDISPEELANRLTDAGLEVEGVEPRTDGVRGVLVGYVEACEQHPNADRLRVCQVRTGETDVRTIVCGAPNVAEGQRIATALPGAVLPDMTIGIAKLRGVESQGMLCSAKELGLETKWLPKEQTEGLYILPDDVLIGADVSALLGLDDVILDISLTPNRSDCLSMRGLAHEVSALFGRPVQFPESPLIASHDASPVTVRIDTDRCSRYDAQVLSVGTQTVSPLWMQMRLLASGIRPISGIVDVTNYVMLEWGQPLHAFDFSQVRAETIVVRQAYHGESLVTLDGTERILSDDAIVIADVERVIGIAGVMGGENSEVTSSTTRIVLESAQFDPASTRRTGQRLGLRSEAQQRFEKGIDPVAIDGALRRATDLLQQTLGATPIGGSVTVSGSRPLKQPATVQFSPVRCNELLGTDISDAAMRDIFDRLGFTTDAVNHSEWLVQIPTRRPDISLFADLVEEVGRLYGLDAIPSTLPMGRTTVGVRNESQKLRKRSRDSLVGLGMTEVFTYTFTQPGATDALRVTEDSPYRLHIPLMLPMSEDRSVLRTHMLPGLAHVASYNLSHGVQGGEIFEIGRTYWPTSLPLTEQPQERTHLAGLWFGLTEESVGLRSRRYDFYDAKGVLESWLGAVGIGGYTLRTATDSPWLHPGRSAVIACGETIIGSFGQLHPETAERLDLADAIYAEFDLDGLLSQLSDGFRVSPLPKFPASRRDLAVLVDLGVSAGDLVRDAESTVAETGEQILESCRVFDVYTGKGVPDGMKSVAIAFVYRSPERTLTDTEIEQMESRILERWAVVRGAQLRAGF